MCELVNRPAQPEKREEKKTTFWDKIVIAIKT